MVRDFDLGEGLFLVVFCDSGCWAGLGLIVLSRLSGFFLRPFAFRSRYGSLIMNGLTGARVPFLVFSSVFVRSAALALLLTSQMLGKRLAASGCLFESSAEKMNCLES